MHTHSPWALASVAGRGWVPPQQNTLSGEIIAKHRNGQNREFHYLKQKLLLLQMQALLVVLVGMLEISQGAWGIKHLDVQGHGKPHECNTAVGVCQPLLNSHLLLINMHFSGTSSSLRAISLPFTVPSIPPQWWLHHEDFYGALFSMVSIFPTLPPPTHKIQNYITTMIKLFFYKVEHSLVSYWWGYHPNLACPPLCILPTI